MLGHLFTSVIRSSTKSFFSKPFSCRSVFESSRRTLSAVTNNSGNQKPKTLQTVALTAGLTTAFWFTVAHWVSKIIEKRECRSSYQLKLTTTEAEKTRKWWECVAKKADDPIEGGSVEFRMAPPGVSSGFKGTEMILRAIVTIKLPNASLETDFKEISDWLKQRGLHYDPSEFGASSGLAEFALRHMHHGVKVHADYKCGKDCRCVGPAP